LHIHSLQSEKFTTYWMLQTNNPIFFVLKQRRREQNIHQQIICRPSQGVKTTMVLLHRKTDCVVRRQHKCPWTLLMWMWKLQYVGYGCTHMNDFFEKYLLNLKLNYFLGSLVFNKIKCHLHKIYIFLLVICLLCILRKESALVRFSCCLVHHLT